MVDQPGVVEAQLLDGEPVIEELGEWPRLRRDDPEPESDGGAILGLAPGGLQKRDEFAIANDSQ
jgi:hypothetical protein